MEKNPFGDLLSALTGGRASRGIDNTDVFIPDWEMVMRKSDIMTQMKTAGEDQATHSCTCRMMECPLHFTEEPTWLTPAYFRQFVIFSMNEAIKNAQTRQQTEEILSFIDTMSLFCEDWKNMTDEKVFSDPRYRAFEVGYNKQLLSYLITHFSFKLPKI